MSYWNVHKLLKDDTRRKIIQFIGSRGRVTYTDILRELGISTGKLNYHLRLLSPLLDRGNNEEYYSLDDLGRNAFALLQGFKQAEQANGNKQLLITISWISLSLSLLAMYYSLFGGVDLRIGLGFVSSALLVLAVAAMRYSRIAFDFDLRHVVLLSLAAVAYGVPFVVGGSLGLVVWSNPFEATAVLTLGPSLINSIIFFPTFLAWSLANKTRKEWALSTSIVTAISILFLAVFLLGIVLTPRSNGVYCTTTGTTSACSMLRESSYISLLPVLLLLTIFSNLIFSKSIIQTPGSHVRL
jgi:winged helix-turn-helix DNA-binding protein